MLGENIVAAKQQKRLYYAKRKECADKPLTWPCTCVNLLKSAHNCMQTQQPAQIKPLGGFLSFFGHRKEELRVTPTQAKLLEFIRAYIEEHTYSPTLDEMAEGVGVWKSTVAYALKRLAERGYVIKDPHRYTKRNVRLPGA